MCTKFTIIIFFYYVPFIFSQQIFDEFASKNCGKVYESIKEHVPKSKIWSIRNNSFTLIFSPCSISSVCEQAALCLKRPNGSVHALLRANDKFKSVGEKIFRSYGGFCSDSKNYTITLGFSCDDMTPKYWHKLNDECGINIQLPDLKLCSSPCKQTIDDDLIDLTSLHDIPTIFVNTSNSLFAINLCEPSPDCGEDVSICKIAPEKQMLSQTSKQYLQYDKNENILHIKGTYKAKKKTTADIHIKCNWDSEKLTNIRFLDKISSSRKYHFEAESSLACIKFSLNCKIKDKLETFFLYNLTSLYKRNDDYKVKNISNGIAYLNICGPLNNRKGICKDQHSQVCLVTNDGNHLNLGSIASSFSGDNNKVVGRFTDGSICDIDSSRRFMTNIEFICAEEKEPLFISNINCTYTFRWETRTACKKHFAIGENDCAIQGYLRHYNLSNIFTEKRFKLNNSSYIIYNLCGHLSEACGQNVSICLIENGINKVKEYTLGFVNKTLILNDTSLMLELSGSQCSDGITSKVLAYFHCHHSDHDVKINEIQRNCFYEMHVYTKAVCEATISNPCSIETEQGLKYDLSPLTNETHDYIIKGDNSSKLEYILNVCRSIINKDNLMCLDYSGVCLKNVTALDFTLKSRSLGQINSTSKLKINNNSVIINYRNVMCNSNSNYNTTIIFICWESEENPILIKALECVHEFMWKTKYACPIKENNISPKSPITSSKEKNEENMPLNEIQRNIRTEKNQNTSTNSFHRNQLNTSIDFVKPNKNSNQEPIKKTNETDIKIVHLNEIKKSEASLKFNDDTKITDNIPEIKKETLKSHVNCTIKTNNSNYSYNLNNITNFQIETSGDNYTVLFNNQSNLCHGFICKNNQVIVPLINQCPKYKFDHTNSLVQLLYTSKEKCLDTIEYINLDLKCSLSNTKPIIKKNLKCNTTITLPLKEACLFFDKEESGSKKGILIGVIVFLVITLCIGVAILLKKYKKNIFSFRRTSSSNEVLFPMYYKID